MFRNPLRCVLAVCACLVAVATLSISVEAQDQAQQDAMQQAMEAAGKPGPQHEQLKQHFVGEWNCEITHMWGPQPETTTGTEKVDAMFGGRFLHSMFNGTMMGQPFQGAGVSGYDNLRQKYFSTWMDSMSTSMMVVEGTYDEATKTYTFTGKMPGPGGMDAPVRELIKIDGPDKHTFEMHMPGPDGKEAKMMTIVYTRKK